MVRFYCIETTSLLRHRQGSGEGENTPNYKQELQDEWQLQAELVQKPPGNGGYRTGDEPGLYLTAEITH